MSHRQLGNQCATGANSNNKGSSPDFPPTWIYAGTCEAKSGVYTYTACFTRPVTCILTSMKPVSGILQSLVAASEADLRRRSAPLPKPGTRAMPGQYSPRRSSTQGLCTTSAFSLSFRPTLPHAQTPASGVLRSALPISLLHAAPDGVPTSCSHSVSALRSERLSSNFLCSPATQSVSDVLFQRTDSVRMA